MAAAEQSNTTNYNELHNRYVDLFLHFGAGRARIDHCYVCTVAASKTETEKRIRK